MLGTKRKQVRKACINCRKGHRCCEDERPCKRCLRTGKVCEEDDEFRLEIHMYPNISRSVPVAWQEQPTRPAAMLNPAPQQPVMPTFTTGIPKGDLSESAPAAISFPSHLSDVSRMSPVSALPRHLSNPLFVSRPASQNPGDHNPRLERLPPITNHRTHQDREPPQIPQALINLRDTFLSGQGFSERYAQSHTENLKDSVGHYTAPATSFATGQSAVAPSGTGAFTVVHSMASLKPELVEGPVSVSSTQPLSNPPTPSTAKTESQQIRRVRHMHSDATGIISTELSLVSTRPSPPAASPALTTASLPARQPNSLAFLLNNVNAAH